MSRVFITECPRDAIQGIKTFIPTEKKVAYLQALLRVGFDVLDFGSFVSPKAIPQMRDTHEVVKALDLSNTKTKLLAIVANQRGAKEALTYSQIDYLGYPFSLSENFQMRNTNKTIQESLMVLGEIASLVKAENKEQVVYLSMGFGNPYGNPWSLTLVSEWVEKLASLGIRRFLLSDTVGGAPVEVITSLFEHLIAKHPELHFGAHLHASPNEATAKINAAYKGGCRAFDSAVRGLGGCPMAKDELVGNVPTEKLLTYLTSQGSDFDANPLHFEAAFNQSLHLF